MKNAYVTKVQRPDGRHQIQINGIPQYQSVAHKEEWDAHHVAHIVNLMGKTMNGLRANVQAAVLEDAFRKRNGNPRSEQRVDYTTKILKNAWTSNNNRIVLADESFAQMMLAASISVPDTPLRADELIAEEGLLFFEKPLYINSIFEMSQEIPADERMATFYKSTPVRAIQWSKWGNQDLMITMYSDEKFVDEREVRIVTAEQSVDNPLNPKMLYQYLGQITFGVGSLNASQTEHDESHASVKHSIALLRSFKAILESQISKEQNAEDIVGEKKKRKARKASKRKIGDISKITVVSLVDQKHGRYELEAATHIKMRLHWVRGHWRNQWYPSVEEHRAIWINGFAKGDPTLGSVQNRTVYTTRSRRRPNDQTPNDQ